MVFFVGNKRSLMNEFQTRTGQIFFSNKKLSKGFVSVLAEQTVEDGPELYAIVELPNGPEANWQGYENIAKVVFSGLRKQFSATARKIDDSTFENALTRINADLADIASKGSADWTKAMNAVIAVKVGGNLSLSTVGKIHAYLFRGRQFSNVADAPGAMDRRNPVKLFENFVVGKLAPNDTVILSTGDLLNYISLDRLQHELASGNIEEMTEAIADVVQGSASKDLSIGTLFLSIGAGSPASPEQALRRLESSALSERGKRAIAGIGSSIAQGIGSNLAENTKSAGKYMVTAAAALGKRIKETDLRPATIKSRTAELTDINRYRALPRAKKFFLGMAALFTVLLVVYLILAAHMHGVNKRNAAAQTAFAEIRQDIAGANGAQTYGDSATAMQLYTDGQSKFAALPKSVQNGSEGKTYGQQLAALGDILNAVVHASPSKMGDYGTAIDRMIVIGQTAYGINYAGATVTPFDLSGKKTGTASTIAISGGLNGASLTSTGQLLFEDKSGNLYLYTPSTGALQQQKAALPTGTIGLSTYANNPIKAYTVLNTSNGGIITEYLNSTTHNETSGDFSQALDIATDTTGAYVLLNNNILKFASGQPRPFTNPAGVTYGAGSKLFTGSADVYILDPADKKIVVTSKTGNLVAQYESDAFSQLKDVSVNESAKTMYVLNGSTILTVALQ